MDKGAIFHTIVWQSHRTKRNLRDIGAAQVLAAGEFIDESKILAKNISYIYGI